MTLAQRLSQVRQHSLDLVQPLEPEDLCLQGMADASPPKWHLGHTTWFFETFVLVPALEAGQLKPYDAAPKRWGYLFNSYYDAVGARHPRPERGLLSRPPMADVLAWRQRVDRALQALLAGRCMINGCAIRVAWLRSDTQVLTWSSTSTMRRRATGSGWNRLPLPTGWSATATTPCSSPTVATSDPSCG